MPHHGIQTMTILTSSSRGYSYMQPTSLRRDLICSISKWVAVITGEREIVHICDEECGLATELGLHQSEVLRLDVIRNNIVRQYQINITLIWFYPIFVDVADLHRKQIRVLQPALFICRKIVMVSPVICCQVIPLRAIEPTVWIYMSLLKHFEQESRSLHVFRP